MAAPDAKTSPSNKEVVQSTTMDPATDTAKTPPAAVEPSAATQGASVVDDAPSPAASLKSPPPTSSIVPSYASAEASEHYVLAKQLLNTGDFEQAMEAIEEGILFFQSVLKQQQQGEDSQLHPSMAPFHYLYGTTLLYSIEESSSSQMMTVGATAGGEENDAAPSPTEDEAPVEDMEIAWEHLDTAREIVETMLREDNCDKTKISLDLAQILLREGDLQRMNGNYVEAIPDYQACMELLKMYLDDGFHRKIADAQYNLGLCHLSQSTELLKQDEQQQVVSQEQQARVAEHCRTGVSLYLECARTLCGQLALLCGVDPSSILSSQTLSKDEPAPAGLKTTGLEDLATNSDASQTLRAWRQRAGTLPSLAAGDSTVEDLRQLLEEIQEIIDEAEQSQEAIRQATQIKLQAQKAVAGEEVDGVTTTIGFDKPTMTASAPMRTSKPSSVAAVPMMVVKKKKKRDASESAVAGGATMDGDSKPAALPDAKRAKTA